jgi:exodeoxyribonuclease V alpha subunit
MISRNDPSLGLFNGDIGLCLYDETIGQLRVWFEQSDGSLRAIMPGRLPEHETVYAMTIHKSQGSEFPHVMIVLPENMNPLLSRELLYTAITRAKERVDVAATKSVFMHTVNQQVQRNSGLQAKLSTVVS